MKISAIHFVLIIAIFHFLFMPRFSVAQSPTEKLSAHGKEFQKEVIEVTNSVYIAIGFALANSILIEGDDVVIIVDVTSSPEAAEEVKAAFAEITNKPIEAIIYTHGHPVHTGGATAFAKMAIQRFMRRSCSIDQSETISSKSLMFVLSGNLAFHFHQKYFLMLGWGHG